MLGGWGEPRGVICYGTGAGATAPPSPQPPPPGLIPPSRNLISSKIFSKLTSLHNSKVNRNGSVFFSIYLLL